MSKKNKKRFPSDANQQKPAKPVNTAAAKAAVVAPAPVEGKVPDLVEVHYKKKNQVHLSHVYALHPGVNHVPKEIWAQAKKVPAIAQLVKDGHVVGPKSEEVEPPPSDDAQDPPAGDDGQGDPDGSDAGDGDEGEDEDDGADIDADASEEDKE